MVGWILFSGLLGLVVGVFSGLIIGAYYYAKGIVKMVEKGEIVYVEKGKKEQSDETGM